MELYSTTKNYQLYHWNMLDMLEVIEPNTISSIVTDPPYELNFMWKWWDNSWIAFQPDTWKKCLEVLKPWWYLLAFWGSRTYHRIACAIEDAGFEIRDCIMWLYGSWFPKSMALDKSIEWKLTTWSANKTEFKKLNWEKVERGNYWYAKMQNEQWNRPADYNKIDENRLWTLEATTELAKKYKWWGTALKPSYEPIIVARKPLEWSCTDNVIKYWVGGINIDECRVWTDEVITNHSRSSESAISKWIYGNSEWQETHQTEWQALGRFPANTILTYWDDDKEEVCSGFPNTKSTYNKDSKHEWVIHRENADTLKYWYKTRIDSSSYNDEWSAARYFYCAKASKRDRDEGLDEFEEKKWIRSNAPREDEEVKTKPRKNTHPTVKPTDLMQYLVRLVTPNGWTVLDPFNWSGSTWKAVMYENKDRNKNYKYIWIELTDEYLPIAKARIEYAINVVEEKQKELEKQKTLFDI